MENSSLPRSTPEEKGVKSAALRAFIEDLDQNVHRIDSLMVVRRGAVIAEVWWPPHTPTTPHVMYSLSKSFTSTAVGFAVTEGLVNLDDKVLDYFPNDAPLEPSKNLKAMSLRDLLTMSTGHQVEPKFWEAEERPWTKHFLAQSVPHEPGTHFLYNTAATYMTSAILQKVTNVNLVEYLMPRLFEPLGIQQPKWEASPDGITLGGTGLFLCTEDIAKFGQFLLQKGKWNDEQLLPQAWVKEATWKLVSNGSDPNSDWQQGYGYQFWRCRYGAYRGDGMNGQFCIVMPYKEAVVVMTSDTKDMGAELELVWKHMLPAIQSQNLPENAEEQEKLRETIDRISKK